MNIRGVLVVASLVTTGLLTSVTPAASSFHLLKISEVSAGVPEARNAQFIELQMSAEGQNLIAGHTLVIVTYTCVRNACVGRTSRFSFPNDMPNGRDQSTILAATAEAEQFFGVSADLPIDPVLGSAAGSVCFDPEPNEIDCVGWGDIPHSEAIGTPFDRTEGGIPSGSSIMRKTAGGTNPNGLDAGDDTDNSAKDFVVASPSPRPNSVGLDPESDTERPRTRILKPNHGSDIPPGEARRLSGIAKDDVAVDFVEVAIRRRLAKGCRWWSGSRWKGGGCRDPWFVRARGTERWRYALEAKLAPTDSTGRRYTVFSRATDHAGNAETKARLGLNRSRFRISMP